MAGEKMFVQVNGIRLYYEKVGSGPAMILLHGNKETHAIFDRCIEKLQKHFTVYAIDSRNHGKSEHVETLSYSLMAQDVIELIRKLKIHQPILYGFSDGGIVGLLIAIKEANLLSSLIISGANISPYGLKRHLRILYKILYVFTKDKRYRLMLYEPNLKCELLHRIVIPTVVLAGEHDAIKEAHTKMIAHEIRNARLEILAHETHDSYVVHSERLYDLLMKYTKDTIVNM